MSTAAWPVLTGAGGVGYLWYPISANYKCALLRHAGQTWTILKASNGYRLAYCALTGPHEPSSKTCQFHSHGQLQLCTTKDPSRAAEPFKRYVLVLIIYECASSLNSACYAKHLKTQIRCNYKCESAKAPSSPSAGVRHYQAYHACYKAT